MFLSHGLLVSCFKIWRSLSLMVLYNQSLGTLGKKEGIKYWSKRYTIGTPSNLFYQQPKNFIVCGSISTINLFSLLSRSLVGYVALSDLSMASGKSNDFDVRNIIILKMRKYMRYFSFCCFFFSGIGRNILILKIPNWTTVLYSTCKNLTCRTQANSPCSMNLEHYKRVIEC